MEKELKKNHFCSAMAGVKLLHYVDVKNVVSQKPSGDGWNVILKNNHYWSRIHFSKVKVGTDEEGESYRHTIEAHLPGKDAVAARDLMKLQRGRYLVRVTDNNGVQWLVGDTTTALHLAVRDENEGEAVSETAYILTFSGLTQWPQMILV